MRRIEKTILVVFLIVSMACISTEEQEEFYSSYCRENTTGEKCFK